VGGIDDDPRYELVCQGSLGALECVEVGVQRRPVLTAISGLENANGFRGLERGVVLCVKSRSVQRINGQDPGAARRPVSPAFAPVQLCPPSVLFKTPWRVPAQIVAEFLGPINGEPTAVAPLRTSSCSHLCS
jgi:hypothetical protein